MEDSTDKSLHIRLEAVQLLHKLGVNNENEICIPSLLEKLELPISYEFHNLSGLAGFTCYNQRNQSYRIFLDSVTHWDYPQRSSFTMAHELGHILLGHFLNDSPSGILEEDPSMEIEANIFADELLMPTAPIVENRLGAFQIMRVYNVSAAAANNKVRYLKRNPLYKEIQELEQTKVEVRHYLKAQESEWEREYMVRALREHWLDPDYPF